MPNATFSHTNGTITFTRTPSRPDHTVEINQPARRTSGGTRFGFAQILTKKVIRVNLRMTTIERANLVNFFYSIAQGMAEKFTYTDALGTARAVRFDKPTLDIQEKAFDTHIATLDLRVFSFPWAWADGQALQWDNGQTMGGN